MPGPVGAERSSPGNPRRRRSLLAADRAGERAIGREAPWFDDAERAALALAEAMTRLADRADPVPDAIWDEVARHYDERQLAALVLWIATSNLFNRINVTTRQPAGEAI